MTKSEPDPECFVKSLGVSPCRGEVSYRITLPELPESAQGTDPFKVFACESDEHLGLTVAGASSNPTYAPVKVERLTVRPQDRPHSPMQP